MNVDLLLAIVFGAVVIIGTYLDIRGDRGTHTDDQ